MINLISKNKSIKSSTIYHSYLLLKLFKKNKNIPIYSLYLECNKMGIKSYQELIQMLCFLHSLNLIDIKEPYICKI